jgi:pimeloyl-ACP methyl ester carboxylesterase
MTFMVEAADPEEPRQHIVLRQYQSSSISNGREYLVRTSLDEGATHVLFIDDDMSFAPGVPIMLLRRNLPLVGCNYPIRFEGMPFSAFAPDFQTRVTTRADSPDLEEGGAVGFGMCLIAREVFEAMPQPWFDQRVERQRQLSGIGLAASLRGMGTGAMEPLWHGLGELDLPVLVVTGESDEKFRTIASAMVHRLPCAIQVVIPGAGHAACLESPVAFLAAMRSFLQTHGIAV